MIKIGIIGCGKIADAHAIQIQNISGCKIVGVCDSEELMAKQMYERFKMDYYFSDVQKLLEVAQPHVVHITTPPQSHYELGKLCLEAGCHIYVEKPFTLDTTETEKLIKLATEKNLKITVGHNAQFNPATIRMRELIKNGFLGGPPVHMESIWCYHLGDKGFATALLGDKNHWVRSLPGTLLQNIIGHGIIKIAEFLTDESPKVIAHGFISKVLKSINEFNIIDELRVVIHDSNSTAYFTFSSQISPTVHQFRLYGPKNSLIVDDDHQSLIKINNTNYKSYLNYFIPPSAYAKQYYSNSWNNLKKFIKRDFHIDSGRKTLIESFYRSITESTPLPISYREILLTSKIMDDIFTQINSNTDI